MKLCSTSAAAVTALAVATAAARADDVAPPDRAVHVPLTLGLGVVYFVSEGPFKSALSKDTCRWCGPILFDRATRDGLRWDDRDRADLASDVTGYIAAPLVALGGLGLLAHSANRAGNWFDDGLITLEAAAIAGVVNFAVKAAFARERPFVFALAEDDKPRTDRPQDNNQSFYSGHSTLSMSLAVATGTVARMRGYDRATAIYGVGIALSLTTGYLRIAADKHWATDVITGWATGAAIGYAVPRLLHRRRTDGLTLTANRSGGGSVISLSGRF
jgi:hypothetical protein